MKDSIWAGEMAQWVEAFVDKPEDLSSMPGNHAVKGENQLLQVVFIHTQYKQTNKCKKPKGDIHDEKIG